MQIRQNYNIDKIINQINVVVPEIIELDNGVIPSFIFRNTYDFMIILE